MAIALSDYLTWLNAQSPAPSSQKPAKGRSAARQDGGQAQGDPAPAQPDFSYPGRVALAESNLPGAFFSTMGILGGPVGGLIGMGFAGKNTPLGHIPGLLDQNQNLVNQLTEQEYAAAMSMGAAGRTGETPGAGLYGGTPSGKAGENSSTPYGWGPAFAPPAQPPTSPKAPQGIGIDDNDPGAGAAAAAAAASAAAAAAAAATAAEGTNGNTGVGVGNGPAGEGGGVGGGGAYHSGGTVRDVSRAPGGNEPITAQQGEFVVARGPAVKYRKLLEAINADDPARIKKHATLKEALTR